MKSSSIRLLAIDVDGTLLDSAHHLRADVKDSVCRLAASGLEVVLATARGPAAVREIVRQFDFSPWLICFSGGWIGQLNRSPLQRTNVQLDKRIPSAADLLQVAAIGDAPNDLEMLSEVGLSIAMGNASNEVKLIAEWVVGTNDEAGVAQAVSAAAL